MYCQVYERGVLKERPKANKKGNKIRGAAYWWDITGFQATLRDEEDKTRENVENKRDTS